MYLWRTPGISCFPTVLARGPRRFFPVFPRFFVLGTCNLGTGGRSGRGESQLSVRALIIRMMHLSETRAGTWQSRDFVLHTCQPLTLIILLHFGRNHHLWYGGIGQMGSGWTFGDQLLFKQTDLQPIISCLPSNLPPFPIGSSCHL